MPFGALGGVPLFGEAGAAPVARKRNWKQPIYTGMLKSAGHWDDGAWSACGFHEYEESD